MRLLLVASLVGSFFAFAGCGGQSHGDDDDGSSGDNGTGGTSGVPADWAGVCARTAAVNCGKWVECAPFLREFALPSDCPASVEASCRDFARLTDTSTTRGDYLACLEAFGRQSCDDWLYNSVTPVECEGFVGTRSVGQPCGSGAQCASGACSAGFACGICETRSASGESCLEASCAAGLVCNAQSTCVRPRHLGDPCSADSPCTDPVHCRNGVCSKPAGNGEPCGNEALGCDFLQGLRCGPMLLCEPWPVPGIGEACTGICAAGAACSASGICVRVLAEGTPCTLGELSDDFCDRGLECIDDVCARFDPTTCG
jgi:hypothetical protein